ncbi:MAG: Ig-like domain repeat protein [Terriglobia bacterium]
MKTSHSLVVFPALLFVSLAFSSLNSLAQSSAARARVTQAVDAHDLVTLAGNVHPLARREFDQGVAPDDLPLERILLILQRGADQEAALRQLLDDQQVKSSPRFHQWLTPEQFGQQFGPADSDLQAVTDWLATQGFNVTNISAGRTVIEFSGTAGVVRQALGTEMHRFRVNGEDYWANTSDPQIPAALAPVVAGFASLNNFPRKPTYERLGAVIRSKATGKAQPAFTFPVNCSNGSSGCYSIAVGPGDFATIYNVAPLWTSGTTGAGQTIAVVGETNINPQDVADFRAMFGLPANPPNIILNGPDPGILTDGEETESDLDVEWSGAVAKGATIDLVVSEATEATAGIDLSALYIIDNNLAPVMSESYSACEADLGTSGNQFYSTLWEQAAAQGITVLLSTGDSGSAGCDSTELGEVAAQYGLAVTGFASTPFNVAVGGTDLNLTSSNISAYFSQTNTPYETSALSYIPETTWNFSCADSGLSGCTPPPSTTYLDAGYYLAAGGGGASEVYSKPSWQSGTGVPSGNARDLPDVSLLAEGYIFCEMDANASYGGSSTSCDLNSPYLDFQGGGGTSASVQAFAGIMALVNQAHGRQGNANYVLYPMAAPSGASCNSSTAPVTNSSCTFYDVTVGNNSVICQGGSLNCSDTTAGQYGVMASGGSPAYVTTAGYDLATGLGSVNVANLVNNWKSNFTPSATTLTLSTTPATNPITLTHGQPVNFTVNVTSGSGTPTGDVSLIAQTGGSASNATGIGPFTLSGGSASNSTIMLPGGSYNVTAHYAGNGTFAASDSTPGIPVTVSKESSQTEVRLVTLSSTAPPAYNVTSVPYGSPYVLRMDVTNSSGNLCAPMNSSGYQYAVSYPCPTGSLTVSPAPTEQNPPAGTVPGSYTLNSQGYAEDQPIQLSPGTYPFVATYAGDNSYTASTSPTTPIIITQAPTTTTVAAQAAFVVGNAIPLTITIMTQSSGIKPTGTVQLLSNGSPLGSAVTVMGYAGPSNGYSWAQASAAPTQIAGGLTVTAQYSGDSNYAGSTSAAITVPVCDFSLSANPSAVTISAPGHTGTSTISVTPEGGFNGTVFPSVESGCPTGATCTFPVYSFAVNSASGATVVLYISTTGSSSAPPALQRRVPPRFRLPVGLLWLFAGSLGLGMLLSSSAMRRRPAALFFATALLVLGVWAACGGGGGGGGTSPSTPTPAVSLSSTSLTFSPQNLGTTSASQTVTLTNTGTATLSITSVNLTGTYPGDFAQTNNCGSSVAAGASCTINVTFTPAAVGSRSAEVSILDNASGSLQLINLSGTGAEPPTPPGTYPVVVNVATGVLSHSITINVTVQ